MTLNASSNERIIGIVEDCIQHLIEDFRKHPERYNTENDVVCNFYLQMRTEFSKDDSPTIRSIGPSLIHTEFPTPFRCKMGDGNFTHANDDERTESGKKYKRGHFDIVILNPSSVARFENRLLRSQDYESYKENVAPHLDRNDPLILYGIEFGYEREPLTGNGAKMCNKKAIQDHDKLDEAMKIPGFMEKRKTVVFAQPRGAEERQTLLELKNREGVELVIF